MSAVSEIKAYITQRTDGAVQRKLNRERLKAIGKLVRSNAELLEKIAETVGADKRIDAATLRAVRANADTLALLLDEEDDPIPDDEEDDQ